MDTWARAVELFDTAITLPKAERDGWLRKTCSGNASLFTELRSLLAAAEAEQAASLAASGPTHPAQIGGWRILRPLGSGGMASVFLAERAGAEFHQFGALKLLAPHLADTYFLERFKSERQILATLNHPHITKLLDGGVSAQRAPYLVMEYVEGEHLDDYVTLHALHTPARLRLFVEVCNAVEAAHRSLIVHLDLKPSNILVDANGVPKLLDFGTAKLLQPTADVTQVRSLTPRYASPEQRAGQPVTTAADIYSLGVILREIVTTVERGSDLDAVISKATAEDAADRYASAAALAADLERYLSGRPVLAKPQTAVYKFAKFTRRNARVLTVITVLAAGLLISGIYAWLQQRDALREAEHASAVNRFLLFMMARTDPSLGGRVDLSMREFLDLVDQNLDSAGIHDAATTSDLNYILGTGFGAQMQFDKAQVHLQKAVDAAQQVHDIPRQVNASLALLSAKVETGRLEGVSAAVARQLQLYGQYRRSFDPLRSFKVQWIAGDLLLWAEPAGNQYVALLEGAVSLARSHPDMMNGLYLSQALSDLAEAYIAKREYGRAATAIQEAVSIDRAHTSHRTVLAEHLSVLARTERFLGHYDLDERYQRESFELTRERWGSDNVQTALMQARWAYALTETPRLGEAAQQASEALRIDRAHFPPGDFELWTGLATAAYTQALVHHYAESEALAREALRALGPKVDPNDARYQETRGYLGLALAGAGRREEARALINDTLDFYSKTKRSSPYIERLRKEIIN